MDYAVKFVSPNLVTQKVSSNSETIGNGWFPHLEIAGVGESVGIQVVSMRGRISCMTRNISYNAA